MPELPEVETVRRGLEPVMTGQRIAHADIRREGLRWPFPDDMAARLEGQRVERLRRRWHRRRQETLRLLRREAL